MGGTGLHLPLMMTQPTHERIRFGALPTVEPHDILRPSVTPSLEGSSTITGFSVGGNSTSVLTEDLSQAMIDELPRHTYAIRQLPGGIGKPTTPKGLGVAAHWNAWWNKNYVPQQKGTNNINHLDEDEVDLDTMVFAKLRGHQIPKIAGKLAAIARTELTIIKRDKATVLVVREFILRLCQKHDMRKCDITNILPYAEKLAFIPTRHELQARSMTLQHEYLERDRINQSQLYTRERPWFFNWFGAKRSEPVVEDS